MNSFTSNPLDSDSFFQQTSVGYIVSSLSGKILKVNQAIANILNITIDDIVDTNIEAWCAEKNHWQSYCQKVIAQQKTLSDEIQMKRSDQKILYMRITSEYITDPFVENEPVIRSFLVDNTEARELKDNYYHTIHELSVHKEELKTQGDDLDMTRELLEKAHRNYKDLFNLAPVGYLVHDINGMVIDANDTIINMIGTSKDNLIRKPMSQYISQKHLILLSNHLRQVANHTTYTSEMEMIVRDDQVIIVEMASVLADKSEKDIQIRTTLTDISERKKLEKELIQAREQADTASKNKSEFLANLGHEIRTPLNSLVGFSRILKDPDLGALNEKQLEFVDCIMESSHQLLYLMNDILDLSKIEAGIIEIDNELVVIREMLENVDRLYTGLIKKSNVEFHVIIDENVPESLIGDTFRIEQVLRNLITNAAKFTTKGKIELIVKMTSNTEIIFEVKDTGIGISEESIDIIFNRYYQEKKSETKKTGTGLGLAISKQLVELMGGRIWFSSKPGKGTSFYFTLKGVQHKKVALFS
jgi:PAS domain S-box-containing protein